MNGIPNQLLGPVLHDETGARYRPVPSDRPGTLDGWLAPGAHLEGFASFLLPDSARPAVVAVTTDGIAVSAELSEPTSR
jgi:hypothetical protein